MRVLVDSSVWIDYLNGYDSPERAALHALIQSDHDICTCGLVVSEVFQGLRREAGIPELDRLFRDLTLLEPRGFELYLRAASLYRLLRRQGFTVRSTIDCLIATLAEENGCALLARDRDLDVILSSGLVAVARWS